MRWRTAWPALVVGLALAVGYGEVVARPGWLVVDGERPSVDTNAPPGFRSVGNDLTRYYLPRWVWIRRAVERTGRVPAWDVSGFGGRPLVGNPQAGLVYPPSRPLRRWGGPSAPGWLTLGHLTLGAWGAYRLARACGQGREGATLAACSFGLGPQLVAHFAEGHYPHLWGVAWYPWAFRSLLDLVRGVCGASARLAAYLSLSLVTGHPQEGVLLAVAVGCLGLGLGRRAFGSAGRVALLVVGLTAAEWMPMAAVAGYVARGGGASGASGYDWEPIQVLQLLSPTALGRAHDYIGPGNLWESLFGFGWATLALAVVGARRGRPRRLVRVVAGVLIVAVIYAGGPKLGLYAVGERMPVLGMFRTPGRALLLATLGVSLLAGYGIETFRKAPCRVPFRGPDVPAFLSRATALSPRPHSEGEAGPRPGPPEIRCATDIGPPRGPGSTGIGSESAKKPAPLPLAPPAAVGLIGIAVLLGGGVPGAFGEGCRRVAMDPVFWASTAGIMAFFLIGGRCAAVGLLLLGAGALACDAQRLIETSPPDRFLGRTPLGDLVRRSLPGEGYRVRARDAYYTDLDAARDGVEKTNVGDLFQLEGPRAFVDPLLAIFSDRPRQRTEAERRAALDRLGVAVLVSDREEPGATGEALGPGVWKNQQATPAMPRAYIVPGAIKVSEPEDPLAMLAEIDPAQAVVVSPGDFAPAERLTPGPPAGSRAIIPADWDGSDPDRPVVRVETLRPGYLVVVQAWMPGWAATVDGEPTEVVRADHAWQAVALPIPGKHEIVLAYRPPGRALGWGVSGATAFVLFGGRWLRRREAGGRRGRGRSGWRPSR